MMSFSEDNCNCDRVELQDVIDAAKRLQPEPDRNWH